MKLTVSKVADRCSLASIGGRVFFEDRAKGYLSLGRNDSTPYGQMYILDVWILKNKTLDVRFETSLTQMSFVEFFPKNSDINVSLEAMVLCIEGI